jgi:hypothetical protein
MTRVFMADYRTKLAKERDRITYELRVTRWNTRDLVTKEMVNFLDLELNS